MKRSASLSELARRASTIFSTAAFRRIMIDAADPGVEKTLIKLAQDLEIDPQTSRKEILGVAFDLVAQQYRSEYFYKNLIATKIFVGKHRAARSALLHELKIGPSVADCVLINGRGTVYEIKTEYDNPTKLATQIASYYEAFRFVNVVTDETHINKYLEILDESPVGIISAGRKAQLTQIKNPVEESKFLKTRTIFNMLRLEEITEILRQYHGQVPSPPTGIRYRVYLSLAQRIQPRDFHTMAESALKRRSVRHSKMLLQDSTLLPLRSIMTALDPPAGQQLNLRAWLEQPIG